MHKNGRKGKPQSFLLSWRVVPSPGTSGFSCWPSNFHSHLFSGRGPRQAVYQWLKMSLKTCPGQTKFESYLSGRQAGVHVYFKPCERNFLIAIATFLNVLTKSSVHIFISGIPAFARDCHVMLGYCRDLNLILNIPAFARNILHNTVHTSNATLLSEYHGTPHESLVISRHTHEPLYILLCHRKYSQWEG